MSVVSILHKSKLIQTKGLCMRIYASLNDNPGICEIKSGLTMGSYYRKIDATRLAELKGREVEFSPSRARERLATGHNHDYEFKPYDCRGTVNLCSVMQSTVPNPYNSNGKTLSHHNMPGGSQRLHDRHVNSTRHQFQHYSTLALQSKDITDEYLEEMSSPQGIQGSDCERFKIWRENCIKHNLSNCEEQLQGIQSGRKSLQQIFEEQEALIQQISKTAKHQTVVQLSQRDRLKRAVKEYGGTVIVFHVTISLLSLGSFYIAVSSGLDLIGLMTRLGVNEAFLQSQLATGASTFVIAYAVHKVFAPLRIAITLSSVPFIVRHLRRTGFLKPPQPKL